MGSAGAGSAGPAQTAAGPLGGVHDPVRSLYIHVPFCFHKCHYCDFYSFVDSHDQQEAFVERLLLELAVLAPHAGPLETIFAGGGTPSLLRPALWARVLSCLRELFDCSHMEGSGEFTVECNPETVTPELMDVLVRGGVNRVSVGAQSFWPHHLKTLERWHDPDSVGRALEIARSAGIRRRSLDLIFAIPGQTLDEWRADLDRAVALGTSHVSCYNLTYEPGTVMTRRLAQGEFEPLDDEAEAAMHALTVERLGAAGLRRYEVSNYARPGEESLHNLAYWRSRQWLAAGPSASAHVGGWRWKNVPRLRDYLESAGGGGEGGGGGPSGGQMGGSGFSPIIDVEPPDPARALKERLMMGIRLTAGLDAAACLAEAELVGGPSAVQALSATAHRFSGEGLLEDEPGRWRLTDAGFLMADHVAAELMGCVPR